MIKRYQLVLVDDGYLGHKIQAHPSPTGEMVMYDDAEAAIDQARAEERERILRAIDDAQEHARIRYRSDATIDVVIDELGALADEIRSME